METFDSFLSNRPFMKEYLNRQINLIQWFSLISLTFLLLQRLFTVFIFWAQATLIPGPPCASFFGHYRLISQPNFPSLLSKLHEEYGPVVKLWLAPMQLLVSIKDPELLKLTEGSFCLSFGRSSLFISSFNEIRLDPRTGSNSKLTMDDCIFHHLPNPKIVFVKWDKGEIGVHPV